MQTMLPSIIFYVFAAIVLFSALMVVTQNNPVRCVLFLVMTFLASAVLWILMESEFLSLILVLVYVGAVMTLFLFVVMMLNIDIASLRAHFIRYLPFGLLLVAVLTSLLLIALPKGSFTTNVEVSPTVQISNNETIQYAKPLSNTAALGLVLYTRYVFAFELAAVILLVAIVAAITLVHRTARRSKRQDSVKQIMTRRHDRVRLVHMKPEPKQ